MPLCVPLLFPFLSFERCWPTLLFCNELLCVLLLLRQNLLNAPLDGRQWRPQEIEKKALKIRRSVRVGFVK